jgi:hypothetical protein
VDRGVAVAVGEEGADGDAAASPAEGRETGLVEGDATWLQPPINPAIPNATTTVVSFKSFIVLRPSTWPVQFLQAGRQTRPVTIA